MPSSLIIDSCIIIDHWRTPKSGRDHSQLSRIRRECDCISVITEYEILNGMTDTFQEFWDECIEWFTVLPVDRSTAQYASRIKNRLKSKRKTVDFADILIAATALANDLSFVTLNQKHFEIIDGLKLISLK